MNICLVDKEPIGIINTLGIKELITSSTVKSNPKVNSKIISPKSKIITVSDS